MESDHVHAIPLNEAVIFAHGCLKLIPFAQCRCLKITIVPGFLEVDRIIFCGLIISELISNALKHAFRAGQKSEICIEFRPDDGKFLLTVSDNGIGWPGRTDFQNIKSFGLQLVNTLADQLGSSLALDRSAGTTFKLTFPTLESKERSGDDIPNPNPGSGG